MCRSLGLKFNNIFKLSTYLGLVVIQPLLFRLRFGGIVVGGIASRRRRPLPLPDHVQPRLPAPRGVTPEDFGRPDEVLHGVRPRLVFRLGHCDKVSRTSLNVAFDQESLGPRPVLTLVPANEVK